MTARNAGTPQADLVGCDVEPIHIPGAIQPGGLLLIADARTLTTVAGAGAIEEMLGGDWLGQSLSTLLGQDVAAVLDRTPAGPGGTIMLAPIEGSGGRFDIALHRAGDHLLAELEPVGAAPMGAAATLSWLDAIAATFERAGSLQAMCERAAKAFRTLIGFDRVMVYRFLDDDAGRVVAESRAPDLGSFLHHHFPATDIPQQARALYVRNRVRVISDVNYAPVPIRPAAFAGIDLSDVAIRSVSPIHLQYLANMKVGASASVSIVKDGVLWGLIACHNATPRTIPRDIRAAAAALAGGLARQITAKEEAEGYRERLRLRGDEDAVVSRFTGEAPLGVTLSNSAAQLRAMLDGDGLAWVIGGEAEVRGNCPPKEAVLSLAAMVRERSPGAPLVTHNLAALRPDLAGLATSASGVLALPLIDDGAVLLWFRAEQVEEVEWAGNPHKGEDPDPAVRLTPRTSFASWSETVRGRSRRWTLEEVESARRLRRALHESYLVRATRLLNIELERALSAKDAALIQKDLLMREVDHRVQNSLQLVTAFLSLQAREAGGAASEHLLEARSRVSAIALVHRRLYHGDQIETIDLSRYLEELAADLKGSLGDGWAHQMRTDLAPVLVPTDRAINVGLVMAELVINATKYAYAGDTGPIEITLEQHRNRLRLSVADQGGGVSGTRVGFGSRMMAAVVARLGGEITHDDNDPGLRAILTAPIEETR